jgi:hypothetical protein
MGERLLCVHVCTYVLAAGLAGVTYYYCDMLAPDKATFPALELWCQ